MFCTCITQPKSTHTTLFTAQVTKRLVICKLQVSIRQIALETMCAGYCFNTHEYIWKSSNAHNITTLIFAVLSYDTSNGFVLKFPSVLQVTTYICQAAVWPRFFLQSKVSREHFPGQVKFCLAILQQQWWRGITHQPASPVLTRMKDFTSHRKYTGTPQQWGGHLLKLRLQEACCRAAFLVSGSSSPGTSNLCWGQKERPLPRQMCLYKPK